MPAEPTGPLCFIHIPKTAGSAFDATMARLPGLRERSVRIPELFERPGQPVVMTRREHWPPDVASASYVSGHVSWDDFAAMVPHGRFITVMRDPLSRVVSHYAHNRQLYLGTTPADHPHMARRRACFERSLAELVRDPASPFYPLTWPLQVRTFAGGRQWDDYVHGRDMVRPEEWPTLERIATERLDQLWWIGLTETIDRDLQTLYESLGIGPMGVLLSRNVAEPAYKMSVNDLDAETREMLLERLQPDVRLVERARQIAEARHAAAVDRLLARGVGVVALPGQRLSPQLDLAQASAQPGWHRPEGEDARRYVWTGPEQVSVVDVGIPEDCRRWQVELEVANFMVGEPEDVRILVDGVEAPAAVTGSGPWTIVAQMPGAFQPLRAGQLRVSVIAPGVARPSDIGRGADRRILGMAVKRLAVVPGR